MLHLAVPPQKSNNAPVQRSGARISLVSVLLLASLFNTLRLDAVEWVDADVCVYGGTSGGVVAAVQAARLGKSVTLIAVNRHLGGMTSGGLGATDIGSFGNSYIQGMAREFYTRVGQKYGTGIRFNFEPRVAEAVFNEMAAEAGIRIYTNQYLAGIKARDDNSILSITMNNGNVFRARMFIDASYEGDLMAKARVSYTIGRESSAQYGEHLNGVRPPNTGGHQFGGVQVDPYVVPGDSSSGLLPLVQTNTLAPAGSADSALQAYNFRMCLTQNATNRLPIAAPGNYSVAQYELLARYIQGLVAQGANFSLENFVNIYGMPNGKTDINNDGAVSTDFIGANYDYPEADSATREIIWQAHKNYVQGFFYFLGSDPRVPAHLRDEVRTWGLCKDEFTDTGGWPHQLYVREARRMVADYVMTQADCLGQVSIPDPIGLGAYAMDSHNCQRLVVNGVVQNEGDTWIGGHIPGIWPVSYRAIVPKTAESPNLLVPWCVSASHIAFGSYRMEPVFMIVAQSAAAAACMAIDDGVAVQDLSYSKLRVQLIALGQAIGDSGSLDSGLVIDNSDATTAISGEWISSSSVAGYIGANYVHDGNTGKGGKSVRFRPTLPESDTYAVYLRWTADPNRAKNVPVDVVSASGTATFSFDQRQNGGQWVYVGSFPFLAGANGSVLIRTTGTTGYVVADAVRFVQAGTLETVDVIASCAEAAEWENRPGWFTLVRGGEITSALDMAYSLGGTASNGVDYQPLSGTVTIPAGARAATVTIKPVSDDSAQGTRTVILSLEESASYSPGAFSNAMLVLRDRPKAEWKIANFTSAEVFDETLSGDQADPNQNSLPNIVEYALGLDPKSTDTKDKPSVSVENGHLTLTYTRAKTAVDVSVRPQISLNLIDWNDGASFVEESVLDDDGILELRTARVRNPIDSERATFLRLQVVQGSNPGE